MVPVSGCWRGRSLAGGFGQGRGGSRAVGGQPLDVSLCPRSVDSFDDRCSQSLWTLHVQDRSLRVGAVRQAQRQGCCRGCGRAQRGVGLALPWQTACGRAAWCERAVWLSPQPGGQGSWLCSWQ